MRPGFVEDFRQVQQHIQEQMTNLVGNVYATADSVRAVGLREGDATRLLHHVNRVTNAECPLAGVKLPRGVAGQECVIVNHSGISITVYAEGALNDGPNLCQVPNSAVTYVCVSPGNWLTLHDHSKTAWHKPDEGQEITIAELVKQATDGAAELDGQRRKRAKVAFTSEGGFSISEN